MKRSHSAPIALDMEVIAALFFNSRSLAPILQAQMDLLLLLGRQPTHQVLLGRLIPLFQAQ